PFDAYITEHVLAPLGMSHSVWSAERAAPEQLARPHASGKDGKLEVVREWPFGASSGASGIYSSLDDMARFVAFQLDAWPASSRAESAVLARASLRESQSFQSFEDVRVGQTAEGKARARARGQGLGWGVYSDCRFEHVVWHNGGTEGHRAAVYLLPMRGVGVIVLANRDGVDVDSPAQHLLERLHDGGVLPRRERKVELAPAWRSAVEAVLALGTAFDAQKYEALFAAPFRQLLPAPQMQAFLQHRAAQDGACTIGASLDSHDQRWVAAALECESGRRIVEAQLLPEGTLLGFWIGDEARHRERVARRGDERDRCE
ncbi:MAG TPA: serine hydrolase domain-containing protein, partial [Polyangiaceae bacterium]|nr:serine hydrolase domain-containing protein [Polyangiaceae bacterium]